MIDAMKNIKIILLAFIFVAASWLALAAQTSSSSYKQTVIISEGGENISSSSYKSYLAADIINGIITSASYINKLGFFHILLLADDQPCTAASQCEGGFCCSSVCKSSACATTSEAGGAATGGGGGGAAGGGGGPVIVLERAVEIKDFEVTPDSIKEKLALGDEKTESVRVKNKGNVALNFRLEAAGISDFVSLSEKSFSLDSGQDKDIDVNFVGRRLGAYFGSIEVAAGDLIRAAKTIVEVESGKALFDVKLSIPIANKEVKPGEDLKEQITLFNVGAPKNVDVVATYLIKDKQGNVVYESTETFAVLSQKSYVQSIRIPKSLKDGEYLTVIEVRYENSFAVSSELFTVSSRAGIGSSSLGSKASLVTVFVVLAGIVFLLVYMLIPKFNFFKRKKD